MGRPAYSNRKTVESCPHISTQFLNRHRFFMGEENWGDFFWRRYGQNIGTITFCVSIHPDNEHIQFQYTYGGNLTETRQSFNYNVQLISTPCFFGGRRWWFVCPFSLNGQLCNRRVAFLYLGNGKHFGCRHCYNLTYASSKENHAYDKLLRKEGIKERGNKGLRKLYEIL